MKMPRYIVARRAARIRKMTPDETTIAIPSFCGKSLRTNKSRQPQAGHCWSGSAGIEKSEWQTSSADKIQRDAFAQKDQHHRDVQDPGGRLRCPAVDAIVRHVE